VKTRTKGRIVTKRHTKKREEKKEEVKETRLCGKNDNMQEIEGGQQTEAREQRSALSMHGWDKLPKKKKKPEEPGGKLNELKTQVYNAEAWRFEKNWTTTVFR